MGTSTPDLANGAPANSADGKPKLIDKERDFYQSYYLLQSQRQHQHETNRLTVSNFILAGSLAALGFTAGKEGLPGSVVVIVLVAVVLVNLLAVVYARQSRYWVKVHQARAGEVLQRLSPDLVAIEAKIGASSRTDIMKLPSGHGSFLFNAFRSERVQSEIHLILILGIVGFFVLTRIGGV